MVLDTALFDGSLKRYKKEISNKLSVEYICEEWLFVEIKLFMILFILLSVGMCTWRAEVLVNMINFRDSSDGEGVLYFHENFNKIEMFSIQQNFRYNRICHEQFIKRIASLIL